MLVQIAVLHDSQLFREGLRLILADDPSLEVVWEGDSVAAPIRRGDADVLLAGASVEGVLALCAELKHPGARPRVILVEAGEDDDWTVKMLATGAKGVLAKSACAHDLIKAIHIVHRGQIWAGREVISRIMEQITTPPSVSNAAKAELVPLTRRLTGRESEIAHHAACGLSNKEIADQLAISEATVKVHLTAIFMKMGVRDRAQLIASYYRSHRTPETTLSPAGEPKPGYEGQRKCTT